MNKIIKQYTFEIISITYLSFTLLLPLILHTYNLTNISNDIFYLWIMFGTCSSGFVMGYVSDKFSNKI